MLKPLGNRVVLKRLENENETEGGILLASSSQEKSQICEVVAVGEGKEIISFIAGKLSSNLSKMLVKKGDKVVISKYAGESTIKDEGKEYIIIDQDQILAIVE